MKNRFHSFRTRILLSFLLCSLVPLLLCSVLLVQITEERMVRHTREDLQQQISNTSQSMDTISSGLTHAAHLLEQDETILRAIHGQRIKDTMVNAHLFMATEELRSHCCVSIYDMQGHVFASTDHGSAAESLPTDWGILHAVRQDTPLPVFQAASPEYGYAPFQGAMPLLGKDSRPVGYLVVEMRPQDFARLLETRHSPQDALLIVDAFWRPVYASNSTLQKETAPQFRSQLLAGTQPGYDSDTYLYEIAHHAPTGLSLILQRPRTFNTNTTHLLYTVSLFCAMLCIGISIMIYIPLSKQLSAPVQQLQKAFGKLGSDDLTVQLDTNRKDELGQLANSFNRMVQDLKQNREALLQNQQELNQAQIRLLQTQLNPHFLCNTLDTMKWISKIHHVPEVGEMSTNLADILRYCITSDQFVPLYREIDFLEKYIEIQKIRMGDKFDFQVDLPEELGMCIVPKMILQPIVENAVIHGLSQSADSTILVKIRTAGEDLVISVTDNGCGLPEELAGKPYRRPPAPQGKHLGLYNVNTILTRNYGSKYGLYLDRGPGGVGTCVSATLPIQKEERSYGEGFGG